MSKLGSCSPFVPRASCNPAISDLRWIAGFLEGEGCFTSIRGSCVVTAYQKEKWPLTEVQKYLGGSLKQYTRKKPSRQPTDYWQWMACGSRARGIAMTMYSFMSPRRKGQIKLALQRNAE